MSPPRFDTAIVGGLVVDSSSVQRLDIGISGGRIAAREPAIDASDAQRVIVKGVGEGGTIGATAAVANAVADAIGASSLQLPLTPARIVAALESGPVREARP